MGTLLECLQGELLGNSWGISNVSLAPIAYESEHTTVSIVNISMVQQQKLQKSYVHTITAHHIPMIKRNFSTKMHFFSISI